MAAKRKAEVAVTVSCQGSEFIMSKILFNLSICKLKIVVLATTEDSLFYFT